jgi:ribonuclease P protein component
MQRRSRLTGNKRFSQIHQEGSSAANRFLVIRFLANGLDQSRFGILTSKRIGNAVVRNKVKRRLREAIRSNRIKSGWDALFIARKGSDKASYQELRQAADNLLRRSHLVDTGDGATQDGPTAEAAR